MAEPTASSSAWLDRSPPLNIGPGPVRPPQPYVPLRKASPQRLQPRKGSHHPLLYTGPRGVEAFRPSTSPSSASPDFAYATALHPHIDTNYESSQQTTRKNSFETVVPASAIEPETNAWPLWNDGVFGSPGKKNNAKVRQSRSISEGMRGLKERLAWHQEHGAGGGGGGISGPDSSWEELPPPHEIMPDEARTSFRSVMTGDSSYMSSYASTERSSMATGLSSTSDFIKINSSSPVMLQDENFSVEDAIGMYADGFETPSKSSFDIGRDRSPERRISSPASPKRPVHLHRRSRSAVLTESFSAYQLGQENLSPPKLRQEKTSPERFDSARSTGVDAGRSEQDVPSPKATDTTNPLGINSPAPPAPGPGALSRNQTDGFKPVPRDRYGFKKISHHVTLEDYDAWERPYSEHLERRRVKWDALMKQFGLSTDQPTRFPPKSEKIKRYARKGIPPEWRGAAWFWYAGGPGLQKKHEGVYFNLLSKIKRGEELKDTDREHIERDLNRTFPDNLTFKPDPSPSSARTSSSDDGDSGPETPIIGALRRVLQAFAVHRPSIGYCQSLNFIAGLLLLFLDSDEEKAFLLLNVITSDYLPGTHGVSLEGANIDIAVLMTSLKELLPGVWAKLDDQPASAASNPLTLPTVSLATTPWFLTLYLTTLPVESALRIWDVLFIEGSKTLFRAALAIFKLTEPRIKAVQDPMEVFQIVQTAPRALLDVNGLMELCFRKRGQGFGGLSQDTIERRREELRRWKRGGARVGTDVGGMPGAGGGDAATAGQGQGKVVGGIKGRFRSRTKGAKDR